MKKVLVTGSVGFDYCFNIHGRIRDKIILEKSSIKALDLLFTAKELNMRYGGTAGNIAYGLAKLGLKPSLFSVAGKDYLENYKPYFDSLGVEDLLQIKDGHTARYYAISDEAGELIAVFQPNTHTRLEQESLKKYNLRKFDFAVFSAGTAKSIAKHIAEAKKANPKLIAILDPGPILNFFPTAVLNAAIANCDILIANEVEMELIIRKHKISPDKILAMGVETIIRTLGEAGCEVITKKENKIIPVKKARVVVETTGAGDAFRAGFVYALVRGADVFTAASIGNIVAKTSLKVEGGQSYQPDLKLITNILNKA